MMTKNPYIVTALIFAIILLIGRKLLNWGEMPSAFLLLFFFLSVIGIRLDDIVKKISATNDRLDCLLKLQTEGIADGGESHKGQPAAPDMPASAEEDIFPS